MKDVLGQYELTEKQMNAVLKAIGEAFCVDTDDASILHSMKIKPGARHIDTVYASNEEETYFVTFGCSARKIQKQAFHSEKWFHPFVEVFLKVKTKSDEIDKELCAIYDFLLRASCNALPDDAPKYELCLINGYEYAFIDDDRDFHDHKGYWGLFVCPRFKKEVAGMGEVLFYQLLPAYKEELEFVEKYADDVDYHSLCQAIVERIGGRQYFDVSYDRLTENELQELLTSIKK